MDLLFFKKKTLFRKVFFITLLTSLLPLVISWFYVLKSTKLYDFGSTEAVVIFFYTVSGFATLLALGSAFYLSKRISGPITHFTRTATEIARGNFSERVVIESDDEIGRLAKIFNYMTTELRRLRDLDLNRLINEKTKTESVIKNIADGVIGTDIDNNIMMMNSVMEQWFGIQEKRCLDKPMESCINNHHLLQFIRKVQRNTNKDIPVSETEITIKSTKTWRNIFLQARAAKVMNERNEFIGTVTILRDVTREKEIDRMKTELVSMVAHELRSPLTSISGFSELLLDPMVNREQSEEYADIILKEANRLSELINKFLDISRIEAGKSQVKKVPMQLRDIIDKVLDINMSLAEKRGIVVSVRIAPDIPSVQADREMIEQVVLNLFSNAVKYSPKNTAIEIRITEREKDVLLEIEDNGYGIPERSLPQIFEKFFRVTENEKVRDIGGTGLGLALVKEIIDIHGGTISVKSKLGEGSTFYFTLPKHNGIPHEVNSSNYEIGMVLG